MALALTHCPSCRARQEADAPDDAPCRRCESPLTELRLLYAAATDWHEAAQVAIAQARPDRALFCARRAMALLDIEPTRKTWCAALALAGYRDEAAALIERWRL